MFQGPHCQRKRRDVTAHSFSSAADWRLSPVKVLEFLKLYRLRLKEINIVTVESLKPIRALCLYVLKHGDGFGWFYVTMRPWFPFERDNFVNL